MLMRNNLVNCKHHQVVHYTKTCTHQGVHIFLNDLRGMWRSPMLDVTSQEFITFYNMILTQWIPGHCHESLKVSDTRKHFCNDAIYSWLSPCLQAFPGKAHWEGCPENLRTSAIGVELLDILDPTLPELGTDHVSENCSTNTVTNYIIQFKTSKISSNIRMVCSPQVLQAFPAASNPNQQHRMSGSRWCLLSCLETV